MEREGPIGRSYVQLPFSVGWNWVDLRGLIFMLASGYLGPRSTGIFIYSEYRVYQSYYYLAGPRKWSMCRFPGGLTVNRASGPVLGEVESTQ